MSPCDHYHDLAQEALDEWDGQDTVDLFLSILEKTGETKIAILRDMMERLGFGQSGPVGQK